MISSSTHLDAAGQYDLDTSRSQLEPILTYSASLSMHGEEGKKHGERPLMFVPGNCSDIQFVLLGSRNKQDAGQLNDAYNLVLCTAQVGYSYKADSRRFQGIYTVWNN